jgi:hypothetical protein
MNKEERREQCKRASVLGVAAWKRISKERALERYYKDPVFCKQCGKMIEPLISESRKVNIHGTRRKTFCNHSCSAKYNNPQNGRPRVFSPHKCENPKCNNLTKNHHFCSCKCQGNNSRLLKIERFLNGELTDGNVRQPTIRDFLIEKQGGCAICKIPPVWNSKPIVFIVDHIDGDYENNAPENMRAICPNCNSQTDSFGGRNNFKRTPVIKRPKSNPNRK